MTTTQNKGYEAQSTGTNAGTWGDILNSGVIGIIDNNVGGIATKSVAGSNITLSSTESQMVIVRLTGSQSADITLTTSCIGFFFVENLTSNSFNISVLNDQISTSVVVPKGRSTVISDATNGCRIAGTDTFPTGTPLSFPQTSAPTGWTKSTTHNNKAVRIVSGAASSGGSVGFDVAFASQAVTGTVGSTALTINQIPAHSHTYKIVSTAGSGLAGGSDNGSTSGTLDTSSVGGSQGHTHSFTGTAINLDVQYVDFIIATKD
jgi:hypothetical protein